MTDIWNDGFIIERDGISYRLNSDEISKINRLIHIANGRGSIDYYINDLKAYCNDENDIEKRVKAAEKLLEDDDACYKVWQEYLDYCFYDSHEWDIVNGFVLNSMNEEGENNGN